MALEIDSSRPLSPICFCNNSVNTRALAFYLLVRTYLIFFVYNIAKVYFYIIIPLQSFKMKYIGIIKRERLKFRSIFLCGFFTRYTRATFHRDFYSSLENISRTKSLR